MVKVFAVPLQPFIVGVTVTIAVIGEELLLNAVNEGILPVPLAASPMEVVLFVQVYTVFATPPLNVTAADAVPLQRSWFAGWFTCVPGFTVIVKVLCIVELQASADSLTVMVAITGDVPVLRAVKDGIFPVPLAPSPMDVVLLVQL
jgi:hypothetical protein